MYTLHHYHIPLNDVQSIYLLHPCPSQRKSRGCFLPHLLCDCQSVQMLNEVLYSFILYGTNRSKIMRENEIRTEGENVLQKLSFVCGHQRLYLFTPLLGQTSSHGKASCLLKCASREFPYSLKKKSLLIYNQLQKQHFLCPFEIFLASKCQSGLECQNMILICWGQRTSALTF